MNTPPTFDDVFPTLTSYGWLTRDEAQLLWGSFGEGIALEVGCYRGRSTCLIAARCGRVHCVDPFAGFSTEDPSGGETEAFWRTNVAGAQLSVMDMLGDPAHTPTMTWGKPLTLPGVLFLWKQRIEDWTPVPVDFAYLDGDHSYEGTKTQINKARRCRPKVIAVHDVNPDGGGLEVAKACFSILGPWSKRAGSLAVWDRKDRL